MVDSSKRGSVFFGDQFYFDKWIKLKELFQTFNEKGEEFFPPILALS